MPLLPPRARVVSSSLCIAVYFITPRPEAEDAGSFENPLYALEATAQPPLGGTHGTWGASEAPLSHYQELEPAEPSHCQGMEAADKGLACDPEVPGIHGEEYPAKDLALDDLEV